MRSIGMKTSFPSIKVPVLWSSLREYHSTSVALLMISDWRWIDFSSGISSKNMYLCDDGQVLLDHFSHCISMISPFDGKLRRHIHDYSDDLKEEILYLEPEIIYQVCARRFSISWNSWGLLYNADGYHFKSDVYSLETVTCELTAMVVVDMPYGSLSVRRILQWNWFFQGSLNASL